MEEFLKKLGIYKSGEFTDDGNYVIELQDDDEYAKIYSLLDKNNNLTENEDASQLTQDNASIQYFNDDYTLTLLSDYESEQYALIVREN